MRDTCQQHDCKRKYCEQCLLELNAEQGIVMDQLYSRLDELAALGDEFDEALRQVEKKYPIAGVVVLQNIPYPPDLECYWERGQIGPARGELNELFTRVINEFTRLKLEVDDAKLGVNASGFFIYRFAR